MHDNLRKRFVELAATELAYQNALAAFSSRYGVLFDAMVVEMGFDRRSLAAMVGFDPMPTGGNAVMNGLAEPSNLDCHRLLDLFQTSKVKK